jgi:phosphoribosylformylglycinamidine synthase PurS subunit
VLVRPKTGILDPQGDAVRSSLVHLGFGVRDARVGRLIDIELDATSPADARTQVEEMCTRLLSNPLIESFDIEILEPADA